MPAIFPHGRRRAGAHALAAAWPGVAPAGWQHRGVKGYGPETYGDRFADVYDDWYGEVSDVAATVAHVTALAAVAPAPAAGPPGAVLELGAGSGRLAVPLAAAGLDVWALDASAAMVARLRAKPGAAGVHSVVGDMADLRALDAVEPHAPPFAVVLCAFNTFFNLTSTEAQLGCLRAVAARLAPGGRLVIEAFVPPPGDEEAAAVGAVEPRHIGLDEVVLTVSRLDPAARTVTGQHVSLTEAGMRLRPWVLHYVTPEGLDALAAEAGLALVERRAGWQGEPFTDASLTHVSTYGLHPRPRSFA
jgi:SAM-dependent methyltransferase